MKRLLSLIFIVFTYTIASYAQAELTAVHKTGGAECNGVLASYDSFSIVYTFTITDEEATEVKNFTIDGISYESEQPISFAEHRLEFDCDVVPLSKIGVDEHEFRLVYTTSHIDEETGELVKGEDKTVTAKANYRIYQHPEFKDITISPSALKNFADATFTFTLNGLDTEQGYPQGWSYVWILNGVEQQETSERIYSSNLSAGVHNVSVRAINRIGRDVFVENSTAPILIQAVSTPSFSAFQVSSTPTAHVQGKGSTFNFSLTNPEEATAGDKDGWSYNWTVSGVSGEKAGKSVSFDITSQGAHTVTCTATNTIGGTTFKKESRKTITVNVYPDGSLGNVDYDRNVVENRSNTIKVNLSGGQSGKWISATATINGVSKKASISGDVATFTYTSPVVTAPQTITLSMSVHAENQPDGCPEKATFDRDDLTYSIKVWKTPSAQKVEHNELDVKEDSNDYLVATLDGGVRSDSDPAFNTTDGWKCEWRIDDVLQMEFSNRFSLKNADGKAHRYTLTATSYVSGKQITTQSFEWDAITIWPKPTSAKVSFSGFESEPTYCAYEVMGGYTGLSEKGGWILMVKKVDVDAEFHTITAKNIKKESDQLKMNVNTTSGEKYEWRMQNLWKDGTFWGDEFGVDEVEETEVSLSPSLRIDALPEFEYSSASGTPSFKGETDVYYDNGIEFDLNKINGFKGGWFIDLRYIVDGTTYYPSLQTDTKFEIGETLVNLEDWYVRNTTSDIKDVRVTGTVRNGIGLNTKEIKVDLLFHVWPKLKVTSLQADPVQVREGDPVALTAQINPCYSAADSPIAVVYEYSIPGVKTTEETAATQSIPTVMSAGDVQGTEFVTAMARVHLINPHGGEWTIKSDNTEAEDKAEVVITVFRKPQMPESIQLFGNGNTGTYYLQMHEDDATLEAHKYKYYIADGSSSRSAHSDFRWFIIPSEWNTYNLQAATYWDYDNKTRVYSDYRLYNGSTAPCTLSRIGNFDNRGVDQGEQSGIAIIPAAPVEDECIYDMTGRRVESLTSGRLYIVGGKKVIGK